MVLRVRDETDERSSITASVELEQGRDEVAHRAMFRCDARRVNQQVHVRRRQGGFTLASFSLRSTVRAS